MGRAPDNCPMCGERTNWKLVDEAKKGFSVGKAAAGAVLLGPVGQSVGHQGKRNIVTIVEIVDLIMNIKSEVHQCVYYYNASRK